MTTIDLDDLPANELRALQEARAVCNKGLTEPFFHHMMGMINKALVARLNQVLEPVGSVDQVLAQTFIKGEYNGLRLVPLLMKGLIEELDQVIDQKLAAAKEPKS